MKVKRTRPLLVLNNRHNTVNPQKSERQKVSPKVLLYVSPHFMILCIHSWQVGIDIRLIFPSFHYQILLSSKFVVCYSQDFK